MTDAQCFEALERRIVNLERAMLYLLESRQLGPPWSLSGAREDTRTECQDFIDWFMDQR